MKTMMLATAAVLALGVGSAFAGEGEARLPTPSSPSSGRGCPGAEPADAQRGRPEPGRRADRGIRDEPQLRDLAVPSLPGQRLTRLSQ